MVKSVIKEILIIILLIVAILLILGIMFYEYTPNSKQVPTAVAEYTLSADIEKELNEKQAELDKLTEKLSSKELEIEGYKHTVEENTDKKYELQSEINAQNINYQNFEKRQVQIKQEMQFLIY